MKRISVSSRISRAIQSPLDHICQLGPLKLGHCTGRTSVARILITGAAGFVGRHFVRHFLEAGDEVLAVDSIVKGTGAVDPSAGWLLFDPRDFASFTFVRSDCREWFRAYPRESVDYAFHLAAIVGGREVIERDPLAVAEDLAIDASYWRWAQTARPSKTVCFSSSAAYPVRLQREGSYVLLRESMIDFDEYIGIPDMSYGWAKLTCEYLARLACDRYGLRSVCYRPFSGYGVDQDETYPFPSICRRILANVGAAEVSVWGSGRQARDFIHIDDCVRGVVSTMDCISDAGALNLSTGRLVSFIELATMVAEASGYSPRVVADEGKPEGVFARGGDTTKQREYGFSAQVALEDGIRSALSWFAASR